MSENRIEINSGFQGKTYVWVKSGEPVEVSMTCGGKQFEDSTKCTDCLGETSNGIDCISELLRDGIIREVVMESKMNIGKCVICECTTEVDNETFMCEGCADNIFRNNEEENKGMKFIDAIQKYDKITKSGYKVFYMHKVTKEVFEFNEETKIGKSITADIGLLTSDGWYEYVDKVLILPKRADEYGKLYYTILASNVVGNKVDQYISVDDSKFKAFNYFNDEELAQYIADTQLLHRIRTTLHVLNKDKFGKADRCELIEDYIRDNYGTELSRVYTYEIENAIR